MRLRGLRTHLTFWGPPPSGSQVPIFLLHGFLDTGDTFQFLADAFEADLSLIAPDWRGFGRSAWPQDGYWFPDYIADLDALLEVYSPDRPARLVGHSMGGNIASLYAGIRPERVRSLVNLEGFGLPRTSPEHTASHVRRWLEHVRETPSLPTYDSFGQLAERIRCRYPRVPPGRALRIARSWGRRQADGRIHLRVDPRHKRINAVPYRRDEAEACWSKIKAPMLMIFSELSEFAQQLGPDGTDEHFRALIPGLMTRHLPGTGHMMHLECPEVLAPLIERFFREH